MLLTDVLSTLWHQVLPTLDHVYLLLSFVLYLSSELFNLLRYLKSMTLLTSYVRFGVHATIPPKAWLEHRRFGKS